MSRLLCVSVVASLLVACGPTAPLEPIVSDPLTPTSGEDGEDPTLPELRRLGSLAPGEYLFSRDALGAGDEPLSPATLVQVQADAFVVSVEGGPHREISQRDGWPMACLRAPLDLREGALRVQLESGAPVLVLGSSSSGARVGVALDLERSKVVHPTVIATDACPSPEVAEASSRIAAVPDGDVACVFADQESLDEASGMPVPSGAPVSVTATDGDWSSVRIEVPGGHVDGWMSSSLVESGAASSEVDWTHAALSHGRCVFPARADADARTEAIAESERNAEPTIPPIEIERVVRNGELQIRACYEARLGDVPDLRVQLDVLMLVDPDGHVDQAQITRGANIDAGLSSCVLERVRRWRFPPPRTGSVQVRHTFDLRPPTP